MRSSLLKFSITYFVSSLSATDWFVDENSLPESLPELMRYTDNYYADDRVEKAVFWAYKIQYDVISEHNGHVYDAESPLDYFVDSLTLPKTRASSVSSDVVFENNTVGGLTNYETNKHVVRWSQDLVSTEVTWNELQITGNYKFVDNLRYVNGEYRMVVLDVMYRADTPLSKNAELYFSSAPNAIISYSKFMIAFTGNHSIPNNFSATRYFLEEVAFRHVADYAMRTTRKNVTSAIRAAVRPYVLYKNRSDPHFPGADGRLDNGRTFEVRNPFVNGLDNAVQKVKAVWSKPDADVVIVFAENTLYNLSGTFDLHVRGAAERAAGDGEDGGPTLRAAAVVEFAVDRINLNVAYDVLRPNCYCSVAVQAYGTTVRPKIGEDTLYRQQAVNAFVDTVKDHLSAGTCVAIVKMNRYGRRNPFCSQVQRRDRTFERNV